MICFFNEDIDFQLKKKTQIVKWLKDAIKNEGYKTATISIIFCSEAYLLNINKQFLNHDFYTDVITFDYSEKLKLSGDIFIGIEMVRENAQNFHIPFEVELKRVMIHGILHLAKHDDQTIENQAIMREKENFYLNKFDSETNDTKKLEN